MKEYDHNKIEKKWQKEWSAKKVYKTDKAGKKPKYYVLDMFPYPSGAGLHVGHPRGYIASDVFARMKRMQGYNVLHPMGYDAFGLPAEQYAIQHKINPAQAVAVNVATFEKQLSIIGLSYDWERRINTTDPEYYRWTQMIFLKIYDSWYDAKKQQARPVDDLIKLFEKEGNIKVNDFCAHSDTELFSAKEWKTKNEKEKQDVLMKYRLAYEGYSEVNWCPGLGTVLANDEIVEKNGKIVSERGEFPVEKKSMRQWFMRITAYADRLIEGLDTIDWPENIKEIQRNWIGRSEGAEIDFAIQDSEEKIKVFTTRADTLFGVTYVVLSPEHNLISELRSKIKNWNEVEKYISEIKNKPEEERTDAGKEKTGIELKGVTAINPANGEAVPVWIADYVLAGYGTGAVMAVPAHDERDRDFAEKYKLPSIKVIQSSVLNDERLYPSSGIFINSGFLDGEIHEMTDGIAKNKLIQWLEDNKCGYKKINYRMRDAIFARQRYWGEPIPLKYTKEGLIIPLKEKELPLKLPNVKSYEPTGNGDSPLAGVNSWMKAGYETNTMPGWAGSSWYFLRYTDPKNKKELASKKSLDYWMKGGVDMYVGGSEHATGHLLYSRFWHKVLRDYGMVPTEEPFRTLKNQGMILGPDHRKMSKRWGNVINPDDIVKTYGADTLRVYEMFMGPFDQMQPWNTESIIGSRRFIEKVWRLADKVQKENTKKTDVPVEKLLHKTIKKVTEDIERFNFNTAISAMMILANEMESAFAKSYGVTKKDFKLFAQLLAPFASHAMEAIWNDLGEKKSIHLSKWPAYDPKKLVEDTMKIMLQVNGKVRGEVEMPADATEEEIRSHAERNEKVAPWIEGKEIKKVIYVKGKLINIVA